MSYNDLFIKSLIEVKQQVMDVANQCSKEEVRQSLDNMKNIIQRYEHNNSNELHNDAINFMKLFLSDIEMCYANK
jgi:hypothetical protein